MSHFIYWSKKCPLYLLVEKVSVDNMSVENMSIKKTSRCHSSCLAKSNKDQCPASGELISSLWLLLGQYPTMLVRKASLENAELARACQLSLEKLGQHLPHTSRYWRIIQASHNLLLTCNKIEKFTILFSAAKQLPIAGHTRIVVGIVWTTFKMFDIDIPC